MPAAMAVSPVTAARYRLPFLDLARPVRLPDWLSSGVFPAQEDRCPPVRKHGLLYLAAVRGGIWPPGYPSSVS